MQTRLKALKTSKSRELIQRATVFPQNDKGLSFMIFGEGNNLLHAVRHPIEQERVAT
jgi:hypothetical protein